MLVACCDRWLYQHLCCVPGTPTATTTTSMRSAA
jgi:hypothetical protein